MEETLASQKMAKIDLINSLEKIPSLSKMFGDSKSNLHLDIGCAAGEFLFDLALVNTCLLYTSPSPRDTAISRMPSSA